MGNKTAESLKILLLAEQAEQARAWAEMLRGAVACVWTDEGSVPPDEQADVVVADGTPIGEGDSGVIRIGSDAPADVNLPADATARELQLACLLLAEVVRMRRRERATGEVRRRLYNDAFTDPLTGLSNRRAWDKTLRERLKAVGDSRRLCLAVFDLDHFKGVNDALGHAVGDEVLKSIAVAICEQLRQDDFVARIGGDEFGLLFWVADQTRGADVVERVRGALPERIEAMGMARVTASAGVAEAGSAIAGAGPGEIFARADEALRRAKQEGRNRTVGAEGIRD